MARTYEECKGSGVRGNFICAACNGTGESLLPGWSRLSYYNLYLSNEVIQ